VTTGSTIDLALVTNEFSLSANVRFLRASFIALCTALVGCILAFFCRRLFGAARPCPGNGRAAGDDHHFSVRAAWHPGGFGYRDRLGHLSSAGGVFRLSHCAGLVASVVCSLAGLLFGVPYLLSDKTPRIDGKQLELQFEFRAPSTVKIPDQPDGYSIRASLYLDNRQSEFAFIDWDAITENAEQVTIPGRIALLTHSKSRSLLASIGNAEEASQFIELKLPPSPRKEDETWSDWISATQRADLTPVPKLERFAIRYRVQPVDR